MFCGENSRTKMCVLERVYYTKRKEQFLSYEVKDDFVRNGTFKSEFCVSNNVNERYHTTVDYGPSLKVAREIFHIQLYK